MKKPTSPILGITLAGMLALIALPTRADTFGTGENTFTIDFVTIGNPGNGDDLGNGGGLYSSPYGGVSYVYRMGTYEISEGQITRATASGLTNVVAGAHTAAKPAGDLTWYEMAAFVNWLNTSTGRQAAYDLTWTGSAWTMNLWINGQEWQLDGQNLYRHKDAHYFLPSEDEWYKAAYHKNDGVTANYWDYPTASNTIPTQELNGGTAPGSVVYDGMAVGVPSGPADVNLAGGLSPYGTMGQAGNIWDLLETASTGPNDISSEDRAGRGGSWDYDGYFLRSSIRGFGDPAYANGGVGFRVASVPEPSTTLLLGGAGLGLLLRRRRALPSPAVPGIPARSS